MVKKIIFLQFVLILFLGCTQQPGAGKHVDPFIGTGGHGHTYPGAALPFGMVQLSPDTRLTGWDSCSGYHYSDNIIYGFSHTHLSGTGVPDYNDVLFMPTTGPVRLHRDHYRSRFNHRDETARPGYYSVMLEDYNVKAELTVSPRAGLHKYTFPASQSSNIIIDLTHRDTVINSGITFVNDREIQGFRRSRDWARDQRVYFFARFSRPFDDYGIAVDDKIISREVLEEREGKNIKAFVSYRTHALEPITVKVGISAVSIEGARKNLEAETAEKTFNQIRSEAHVQWGRVLDKIKIQGGTPAQQRTFYTALYHVYLNPNLYMDVDRRYRGRDMKIHKEENFDNYTLFSLWDTYRAAHPLFTILEPQRTSHFIRTFITQYRQGGLLPVWELSANETFCMIGYHSIPVIADAYIKGIRDYDTGAAMEAMIHSATRDHFGLNSYRRYGYIPSEDASDSVSKTLEYAYDDWCIAQVANAMGKNNIFKEYTQRAQYYKNVFDPSTRFMRARIHGLWFQPFDPAEVNFNYTEANAWQYSFYVPQDIRGLIGLMGGREMFTRSLDALFTADPGTTGRKQADITGLIGQYAHGNEPSHHMAYLYNYAGQPWKTQQRVRQIMDTMYSDKPDGLCGNEDCGQMSAWYVFSAIGFYPVTPGSDFYAIGTPLFPEAVIRLDPTHTFTIRAHNVSPENIYIQSAFLNGKPWNRTWIRHYQLKQGGTLEFHMGPEPNKEWGSRDRDRPPSSIADHLIVPVPFVVSGDRTFKNTTTVSLGALDPDGQIRYTLDGTQPTLQSPVYKKPIILKNSTVVTAAAYKDSKQSFPLTARFTRVPGDRKITLSTRYANQYSAGGDLALIDGMRGAADFRTGMWQGYEGVHLQAVIDLGKIQTIREITTGFLQDNNAWIFMPVNVEYSISRDGKTFTRAAVVSNDIPQRREGVILKDFIAKIAPVKARYVKIEAQSPLTCPPWHKGAGNKCWIFADEIVIAR